jgi:fimbrial chaperone protein
MFFRSLFVLAACVIALFPAPAAAYEFAPIVAQFSPTGSGAAKTFVVRNTHKEPIALQIEVYRRSADEAGTEIRELEYDDFIVTPPQMVLAPGQSQSIRVQWIGDSNPDTELAYRLVVEQLPIPYKGDGNTPDGVAVDVKLGFRYEAALYVVPATGAPDARISHGEIVKSENGENLLRLTVENVGQRRAILQHPVVTVQTGGQTIELSEEALEALNNRNIIAGTQAVVDVPVADTLAVGPVSASLKTDYFRN